MKHNFWMRVFACTFLAVFALLLPACCNDIQQSHVQFRQNPNRHQGTNIVRHLKDATVALVKTPTDKQHPRYGKWITTCSAVWINNSQMLTAYHCIEPENPFPPPFDALFQGESPLKKVFHYKTFDDVNMSEEYMAYRSKRDAVVVAIDEKNDLALLSALSYIPDHDWVTFTSNEIEDGTKVHIIGHPVGEAFTYMMGVISATRNRDNLQGNEKALLFQVSAPVWFGNSGGGMFDDNGNLLGIASFIRGNAPNMAYFVHKDMIMWFLMRHDIKVDVSI